MVLSSTTSTDLVEHLDYYDHWIECETCTRRFRTQRACNQHMNATDHWAPRYDCETCPKVFISYNAVRQHMNSLGHWAPKFSCETCDLKFHTQGAAEQHMTKDMHYRTYCPICQRHFRNENNLKMVRSLQAVDGSWEGNFKLIMSNLLSQSISNPRPIRVTASNVLSVSRDLLRLVGSSTISRQGLVNLPPN